MFNFPKTPREPDFQYETNLLKSVTFQFKYQSNDSIVNSQDFLKEKLGMKFPNIKPIARGEFKIEFKDKTPILQQSLDPMGGGFELRTENNHQVALITNDSVVVTILDGAYSNFSKVFDDVVNDIFPIFHKFKIDSFNRLAIRKINLIEFESKKDSEITQALPAVFNNTLIDNILFFPCQNFLKTGVTKSIFRNGNYQLNISYGLLEKPLHVKHGQIMLDIDLFKTDEEISLDEVSGIMNDINGEIFNIFSWSIKESFLKDLCSTEKVING